VGGEQDHYIAPLSFARHEWHYSCDVITGSG